MSRRKAKQFFDDAAGDSDEEWDDIDFFDPDEADELQDEEQDTYEETIAELRQGGLSRTQRRRLERKIGHTKTKTKREVSHGKTKRKSAGRKAQAKPVRRQKTAARKHAKSPAKRGTKRRKVRRR